MESAFPGVKSLQGFFLEPFGRPRFRFSGLATYNNDSKTDENTKFPHQVNNQFWMCDTVDMI